MQNKKVTFGVVGLVGLVLLFVVAADLTIGQRVGKKTISHTVEDKVRSEREWVAAREAELPAPPPELNTPFELGQYYFNHDDDPAGSYDRELARYYYALAIKDDPEGNPLQWYQYGRLEFLDGKFDSAIEKFKKQIGYFGDAVPNVHYMLGLTHGYRARDTGNAIAWQQAEEAFEHFIDIYHLTWAARVDLSWIYFSQGKYDAMKPPLEEALVEFPNNPWVHNMYGLALLNTGELNRAHEHFLSAQKYAAELTSEDWGEAYPGNDPKDRQQGLAEFRNAIQKNLALTETE